MNKNQKILAKGFLFGTSVNIVGYVIYYEGERDGGAYTSKFTWVRVAQAMMHAREGVTVCIEPVNTVPEWVE